MSEEVSLPRKALLDPPETPRITGIVDDEKAMKLVAEMLAGNIVDIRPRLDFDRPLGSFCPYC